MPHDSPTERAAGAVSPRRAVGLDGAAGRGFTTAMIYCVIPAELEGELFDRMTEYYRENPNVTVIVDRRRGGPNDRRHGSEHVHDERREVRDRRRARARGSFPRIDAA